MLGVFTIFTPNVESLQDFLQGWSGLIDLLNLFKILEEEKTLNQEYYI